MDPLRYVKLEMLLAMLLLVAAASVIGLLELARWQETAALGAGALAAAGWIVWRTRRALRAAREEGDGAQ